MQEITKEFLSEVYDILVKFKVADEDERQRFINSKLCREYRLSGILGSGGKYYYDSNVVKYYFDSKEKKALKKIVNSELEELMEKYLIDVG